MFVPYGPCKNLNLYHFSDNLLQRPQKEGLRLTLPNQGFEPVGPFLHVINFTNSRFLDLFTIHLIINDKGH